MISTIFNILRICLLPHPNFYTYLHSHPVHKALEQFPPSLPLTFCLFDAIHSSRCEVRAESGFDLHFP